MLTVAHVTGADKWGMLLSDPGPSSCPRSLGSSAAGFVSGRRVQRRTAPLRAAWRYLLEEVGLLPLAELFPSEITGSNVT